MTKQDAIRLFGGRGVDLARALGVTPSAIYQWDEQLSQEQADRVIGAAVRLGVKTDWRFKDDARKQEAA